MPSSSEQRDVIAVAQQLLRAGGAAQVPVTGNLDRDTSMALRAFQAKHGLPRTGRPDPATLAALRRGQSG